jgi:prephenate dehydrogenase
VAEKTQITIVGTGCIGTSIGLALRQSEQSLYIVGHDKEPKHAAVALRMKAVDKTDWNLIGACENADLIILAIPLNGIEETLRALAPYCKEGSVVTDTANLKEQVLQWSQDLLPERVNFIGGDPVVTSTGSGPEAADAGLFRDNLYCIAPAPGAHPDAVGLVSNLVALMGGHPYYLDAAEHDGLIAGVEHLPLVLALALTHGTMHEAGWNEMCKLAGGSYERIITLIGEDPDALSSLLLSNRRNLTRWLDAYIIALREVHDLIASGEPEPLAQSVGQALTARRQWLQERRNRFSEVRPAAEVERGSFMRQLLIGGGRRRS